MSSAPHIVAASIGDLIPVLVVIFFIINAIMKMVQGAKGESPQQRTRGPVSSDEAERSRRIQAEIRRKILERQQAANANTRPQAVPPRRPRVVESELILERPDVEPEDFEPDMAPATPAMSAMTSMMAEYETKIAAEKRKAREFEQRMGSMAIGPGLGAEVGSMGFQTTATKTEGRVNPLRRQLMADLRGPDSIRRAVLLREVLGPPPGLWFGSLPRR